MTDEQTDVFRADSGLLASLMDVGAAEDGRMWQPEELAAVLRHQMSTPIQVDLISLGHVPAGRLRLLAEAQGLLLKSYADLLRHPNPPIELLKLTHKFAKLCRVSPHGPLPKPVATVLYFASIAAAMTRCCRRITARADAELRQGFVWVASRAWVDEDTARLAREALDMLDREQGAAP